ncbi:MAG: hypothetical protein IJN16_10910 [Lachnospiraceae bacterium]|nr:hypothetical protein [Lachnospiraceae bacterium]
MRRWKQKAGIVGIVLAMAISATACGAVQDEAEMVGTATSELEQTEAVDTVTKEEQGTEGENTTDLAGSDGGSGSTETEDVTDTMGSEDTAVSSSEVTENTEDGDSTGELSGNTEDGANTGEASESTGEKENTEHSDYRTETIFWEDLDGNGVEEYLVIERNGSAGKLTVYFNEEPVYQYEEDLWFVGVDAKEYIDLDGDGEKEIFVSFMPAVNSMPLEEWFALKQGESGWELMEMPHYGDYMSDNAFLISVTLQKKDYELLISCEGYDGGIVFDATAHYAGKRKDRIEWGDTSYDAYVNGNYAEGSQVGGTCAWGIWNIETGSYEGQNCLIAEHGLQGPNGKYDFYGCAYVYFNYDENAKVQILNMEFRPDVTVSPELDIQEPPEDTEIIGWLWGETVTPLSVNTTISVDLDEDGKEELISVTFSENDDLFLVSPQIRVNDTVFDETYMRETIGLYMEAPDIATWYIFDVDLQDGYKEIAVYEDGPSGDPWTTLFRYEDGQLRKIGGFSDKPIDDWSMYYEGMGGDFDTYVDSIDRSKINIKVPGDGTIYASQRVDVMETNFAEGMWKLEHGESFADASLELQLREMYEFFGYGADRGEFTPTVIDTLQVYTKPDFETEQIVLTQGENLDLYRYYPQDSENGWVQIAYHNRESFGWLYLHGYDEVRQTDENGEAIYYHAYDLIQNLSYAD